MKNIACDIAKNTTQHIEDAVCDPQYSLDDKKTTAVKLFALSRFSVHSRNRQLRKDDNETLITNCFARNGQSTEACQIFKRHNPL